MTEPVNIESAILECLRVFPIKDAYLDEQRDLQGHLVEALRAALGPSPTIVASTGGTNKPNIKLLGTSFWPDLEITYDHGGEHRKLAIEAKRVSKDHSGAKPIEETLGQCLIYRARYERVIGLVVHYGGYNEDPQWAKTEDADRLNHLLASNQIALIVRRPSDGLEARVLGG